MKTRVLTISVIAIIIAGFSTILLVDNDIFSENNTMMKSDAEILTEINQQAITHQKNEDQIKFDQQAILMQEKLKTVASNALEMPISQVYLEEDFNFPFVDASKIQPSNESVVCDIIPNIPIHFQNIRETEMFQMFSQKYSQYDVELIIQDERRYNSTVHYGFIATSEDKNNTASTHFHASSCNDTTDYQDFYFLRCNDSFKNEGMNTTNQDYIIASFEHDDFCFIPLDPWRQSVYDYGKTVSEKMNKHQEKIEDMDKDYESVMAFQSEMDRLGTLSNLISAIVIGGIDSQVTQEKIQEYDEKFGSLPDELLELIENRK